MSYYIIEAEGLCKYTMTRASWGEALDLARSLEADGLRVRVRRAQEVRSLVIEEVQI